MNVTIEIAASLSDEDLATLYKEAFPDEDLVPLVAKLAQETETVTVLTAHIDSQLAGHMALSECGLADQQAKLALLGPLAVTPGLQGRGIGGKLIRQGAKIAETKGFAKFLVLGDPAFYGRFGFVAERDIQPPYDLPDEWRDAWQSQTLASAERLSGVLTVPEVWDHKSLWAP